MRPRKIRCAHRVAQPKKDTYKICFFVDLI